MRPTLNVPEPEPPPSAALATTPEPPPVPGPEPATPEGAGPPPRPRARFRPHERVLAPGDFQRAFQGRRSVSDAAMVVYGTRNGRDHARLGLSIGKRKVRRASARNRLKRVLREAFRLSKAELPAGLDLIVVPRGVGLTLDQARRSLVRLGRDLARKLEPRPRPPEPPPAPTPAADPAPESPPAPGPGAESGA